MTADFMPHIDHVVVLMLENRSMDNLLGWLYSKNDNRPARNIPERRKNNKLTPTYDGLVEGKYTNRLSWSGYSRDFSVIRGAEAGNVPSHDPNEEYTHVNMQLFGMEDINVTTQPPMQDFLQDYNAWWEGWDTALQILQTFTPEQAPVLNGLARHYAVSDRWFSSVPSQTNPNRAFFTCGTSLGRESNLRYDAAETFETNTIFNVLSRHNKSWNLFYHDKTWPWPNGSDVYTPYTFPRMLVGAPSAAVQPMANFFSTNPIDLPKFTFLEPAWGFSLKKIYTKQGNDYHPPTSIEPGEQYVMKVYQHLTSNPIAFAKTLFVITFDEHGGTYDHVPPPWGANRPDKHKGETGFLFNRYGVRVPTLLISPWVDPGVVFRADTGSPASEPEYDHTSLTATILKWQGIDPARAGLGSRVASAATFEKVLDRSQARTDLFTGTTRGNYGTPVLVSAPAPSLHTGSGFGYDVFYKARGGALYLTQYANSSRATPNAAIKLQKGPVGASPRCLNANDQNTAVYWRDDSASIKVLVYADGDDSGLAAVSNVTTGNAASPGVPINADPYFLVCWIRNDGAVMSSTSVDISTSYTHEVIHKGGAQYSPAVILDIEGELQFVHVYWVMNGTLQRSSKLVEDLGTDVPWSTIEVFSEAGVLVGGSPTVVSGNFPWVYEVERANHAFFPTADGTIKVTSGPKNQGKYTTSNVGKGNVQSELRATVYNNGNNGSIEIYIFWRGSSEPLSKEFNELRYLVATATVDGKTPGPFTAGNVSPKGKSIGSRPEPIFARVGSRVHLRIFWATTAGELVYTEYDGSTFTDYYADGNIPL